MPAQKMHNVGFAIFFIAAVLGAVLLLISQIPLKGEYYDVVETRSFSVGEPLTFYWTFEANAEYRLEVKGVDWTSTPRHVYYLMVGNDTTLWGLPGPDDPPWVWNHNQEVTCAYNVTFWHSNYPGGFPEIERPTTSATVEISQPRETTYRLTYLLYVGLPMLIIGAILIAITGKDVDLRTRMPDTSARRIPSLSFPNTQVRRDLRFIFSEKDAVGGWLVGTGGKLLRFYQILADAWIRRMEHWIRYGDGNGVAEL